MPATPIGQEVTRLAEGHAGAGRVAGVGEAPSTPPVQPVVPQRVYLNPCPWICDRASTQLPEGPMATAVKTVTEVPRGQLVAFTPERATRVAFASSRIESQERSYDRHACGGKSSCGVSFFVARHHL